MLGGRQPIPHRGIEQTHQVMDFLPLVICGRNEGFERKLHSVTIHVHPREKQISISFRNVRGGKQIPIYIVFKSQDFIDIFYQDISPNLKAFCGLRRERPSLADRQSFNISSTSAPDGVHHRVILGEHNGKGKDWSGRTDSYAEPHVDLRRYPPTPNKGAWRHSTLRRQAKITPLIQPVAGAHWLWRFIAGVHRMRRNWQ